MRAVFGLVLIVGLGLAGFAVYMVKGYFDQQSVALAEQRAVAEQAVPTVELIAMNRTINYGEILTKDDVSFIRYAEPFLPEGVFLTAEDLFPEDQEPRIVLRQMDPMEPVLASKVTEPGEDAGLASRLGKGIRAFAINVDATSGVSGFLRPGDSVDVYWTGQNASNAGMGGYSEVTRLISTNIPIIAVDQDTGTNNSVATVANTVTVAVNQSQGAILTQAQSSGRLTLALVGMNDDTVAEAIEVDQKSLLGVVEEAAPEVAQVEEKICTIRTNRGVEKVEIQIPCPK